MASSARYHPRMMLEQPVGARSCGSGGEWAVAVDTDDVAYVTLETRALMDECTGPVQKAMVKSEIAQRMAQARSGDLSLVRKLASGRRVGDVEFMECTRCVLEIRLESDTGEDEGRRHVRLYFTEPAQEPSVLLALMLASKAPLDLGLQEQTEHAKTAEGRAIRHYHPVDEVLESGKASAPAS